MGWSTDRCLTIPPVALKQQMEETMTTALLPLPEDDDTLITRSDLPQYLPVASQTLARWATEGQGPRFIKLGKRLVAYRAGDLREWLHNQSRQNTV